MASGSYKQVFVRCPFYHSDDGRQRITCEGLTSCSALTHVYAKKADYILQLTTYCCRNYNKCAIYKMLAQEYEENTDAQPN